MPENDGLSTQRNKSQPVWPVLLRSMRTIGPPPPLPAVPNVTSEYCLAGGAMLQTPERLWPPSLPLAKPPAFLNPEYPGSGNHRSPSSRGSSTPAKFEEAQAPDEAGAAPVDHEAMVAPVTGGPGT